MSYEPVAWAVLKGELELATNEKRKADFWTQCGFEVTPLYPKSAINELLSALERMTDTFGKPHRDDWLTDKAYAEALETWDIACALIDKYKNAAQETPVI